MPPCAAARVTLRDRDFVPKPHDCVHALNELQSEMAQLMAQSSVLHSRLSLRSGHTAPPFSACCTTVRERCCVPPPHDLVHVLHGVHGDTEQCTAHDPRSHWRVVSREGHSAPPNSGCTTTYRLCFWMPEPHVTEQLEKGVQ